MNRKTAVIAIGGNSLIVDNKHVTVNDQFKAVSETCKHIHKLLQNDYRVVITHGNGPQVGFILRRTELAKEVLHSVPLDSCVADTQGAIGYSIQRALHNIFISNEEVPPAIATVVTQVVVDKEDPSFQIPTKPIGSFMEKEEAFAHQAKDGWNIMEDAGRGWRRVVASPLPKKIVELDSIKSLIESNVVVIAVGGGGIPVIEQEGEYWGAEAVIDKDYASSLLAQNINADLFIISTAVNQVYINFKKENQKAITSMNIAEARKYIEEGQFAKGSMLPKIEAAIQFVETTKKPALITSPETISDSLEKLTGTYVIYED